MRAQVNEQSMNKGINFIHTNINRTCVYIYIYIDKHIYMHNIWTLDSLDGRIDG